MSIDDVKMLKRENNFFKRMFSLFKIDVSGTKDFLEGTTPPKAINHAGPDENALGLRVPESRSVAPDYDKKGESTMAEDTTAPNEKKVLVPGEAEKSVPIQDQKNDKDELTKLSEQVAALTTELARCKQELDAANKELGSKEVRERTQNHREFCESLVAEGRMRPVDVDQQVLNLELRYKEDSSALNFSETKEMPATESYKQWLAAMPKVMCFEEVATAATASNLSQTEDAEGRVMKFCDEYMKADPKMSYAQAMEKCTMEHCADMSEYMGKMGFVKQ